MRVGACNDRLDRRLPATEVVERVGLVVNHGGFAFRSPGFSIPVDAAARHRRRAENRAGSPPLIAAGTREFLMGKEGHPTPASESGGADASRTNQAPPSS